MDSKPPRTLPTMRPPDSAGQEHWPICRLRTSKQTGAPDCRSPADYCHGKTIADRRVQPNTIPFVVWMDHRDIGTPRCLSSELSLVPEHYTAPRLSMCSP